MKTLVFGKSGQLGNQIYKDFKNNKDFIFLNKKEVDFCNPGTIKETIFKFKPKIVINAAAYTNVDLAEKEREKALTINGKALSIISDASREINALLIHFSTDYVFDGKSEKPYKEKDITNPINYYGCSKLFGEKYIINSGCNYIILRISWVISASGNNFIKKIFDLSKKNYELNVVSDQTGVPTSTQFISRIIKKLIREEFINKQEIYHLVPDGSTNWYEISKKVVIFLEKQNYQILLKSTNINPVNTEDFKTEAKRPLYTLLSNAKIKKDLSLESENWEIGLNTVLKDLTENNY